MLLLLNLCLISDQAPSQEKCQERNSVLSDGLRCQRYRYVYIEIGPPYLSNWHKTDLFLAFPNTGRTTFVNTLCQQQVLEPKDADDAANAHIEEGVRIKPVTVGKLVLVCVSGMGVDTDYGA